MKRFFRENGLSIFLLGLFLLTFAFGQILTGLHTYNSERHDHGKPELGLGSYLCSSHFIEATMENWESEFLQMGLYVVLTSFLFQKGSAESKKLDGEEAVDRDPRLSQHKKNVPWPVRKGGWILKLYQNSLSLALLSLFAFSFTLHAVAGARLYSEDQLDHGQRAVSTLQYLATSRFWFESFQNWQSEFLAISAIVLLTIHLRQRGSAQSKPVDSPYWE